MIYINHDNHRLLTLIWTATSRDCTQRTLSFTKQSPHSFMCSKLSLCLLLYVFYSATVKAFPASPPVQTLALTPFQPPDLDPNLRERADTHFVTIYGLYDNSLHTPTVDSSKPKLAPITEAFMAMTRALASATPTGSGSGSVVHSATLTVLHKTTSSALSTGIAIRPTTVQSSVAPSSSDTPTETLETLQRAAEAHSHRLVIFGSVVAGVVCLGLLLFLFLDPRMMRKLCGVKVDDNMHFPTKNFYGRPKPTWDISPISSSNYAFKDEPTQKPFFLNRNPVIEKKQPISKFSVCSSVYPSSSESTSESGHGADTPRSQTSPVRPPRPPTADSPTLSESVYLACADQPYIIVAPQPFTEIDRSLNNSPALPTGPKIFSHDLYAAHPNGLNINSTLNSMLPHTQPNPNPTPEFHDNRHSRTYSAPSFVGSMNDQIYSRSEGTVVQRMLKHRRSRSASGWAYPDRPPSKKGFRICN